MSKLLLYKTGEPFSAKALSDGRLHFHDLVVGLVA